MMCSFCANFTLIHIFLGLLLSASRSFQATIPSYRVCKPGPALGYPVDSTRKNCLIIGDSVSIGYTPYVEKILSDVCQVQHAPWDWLDGGALDTKFGMQCISLFMSTAAGVNTHYDAIVFNFGLHDVQYCAGMYDEEYVPYVEYLNNIGTIYSRLSESGSRLGFASTTPIPYSAVLDDRVKKYNNGVKTLFRKSSVHLVDLYEKVVDICGVPPFNNCSIMDKQPNVHYQPNGYSYLAKYVSQLFIKLLSLSENPKERSKQEQLQQGQLQNGWKICPKHKHITEEELKRNSIKLPKQVKRSCSPHQRVIPSYQLNTTTACPAGMTCCTNAFSITGIGCCVIPDANTCFDDLHCCPNEMKCMPDCKERTVLCYCMSDVLDQLF